MQKLRTILPSLILIAVGYAAVIGLQPKPEKPKPQETDRLTLNGGLFRGFLLGGEGLAADWYWMNALQHVGQRLETSQDETINLEDLRSLKINLLYPYLDAATDLDPHFIAAYSYGAVVLPAINTEQAVRIAEKGIANNPKQWRLMQHLGYIHWRAGNFEKAAEAYQRGAAIEGAAPFMRLMAAAMQSDAGSRTTARTIYSEMAADSTDEAIAAIAAQKLAELDKLDVMDGLDQTLAEFREQNGRCATNLSEITRMLLRKDIANNPQLGVDQTGRIVDATGKPYVLDPTNCVVLRNK
jgi:tetratricopeptide (TPR) repeat protein